MPYLSRFHRIFIGCILSFCLSTCKLGPNFSPPLAPGIPDYIESARPLKKTARIKSAGKSGVSQRFQLGKTISAQWWQAFHSPELNALIEAAFAHSPNLEAAKAALIQAQENYRVQTGALYPNVNVSGFAERMRFNPAMFGANTSSPLGTFFARTFYLFNVNAAVSYTFDVFGGVRRQIEASGAQVDYQAYEWEAALLALSANIVTTSITIASLQAQIQATHRLIKAQEETVNILKQQFSLGGIAQSDVLLQATQLAQTQALLPPLQQQLMQSEHALASLAGELPSENKLPHFALDKLHLPQNLPISCPSWLVQQRPDIKEAEALVHAATAQVGVATANLFPQITLNSNYGQESIQAGTLFLGQNKLWNVTNTFSQTLFNGGALLAKRRAAIAVLEQSLASYKQTILQAFQNVADTLRALENDAELLRTQKIAENSARQSLQVSREQYRLGGINYATLLIAERAYQQAVVNRIQAQAARFSDTAALFQALGGGWWNRCTENCSISNQNLTLVTHL